MPIIFIDEYKPDGMCERQLPNGVYRYEGDFHSIRFCIDTPNKKTKKDIFSLLDTWSIDYLLDREGTIITLKH